MFEDIIKSKPKPEPKKIIERSAPQRSVNTATWKEGCHSCKYSSKILSNYRNKLLCVEKRRHVDPQFFCNKWESTN